MSIVTCVRWFWTVVACGVLGPWAACAQTTAARDLTGYRTTSTAITAQPSGPAAKVAMPAFLGVVVSQRGRDTIVVVEVADGSPAARAGIVVGDQIARFGADSPRTCEELADAVMRRSADEQVQVSVRRKGRLSRFQVTLAATSRPMTPPTARRRQRLAPDAPLPPTLTSPSGTAPRVFKGSVYRLGVLRVQFPDVHLNESITDQAWSEALFSTGTYVGKVCVTGQPVYGSLNDYYREVSCGALSVDGRVLEPVTVAQPRASYGQGTGARSKAAFLNEALDLVSKRDGREALDAFDGLLIVYAGARVPTNRGGLFWPHRSSVTFQGKRRPYVIVPEGGTRMTNISVIAHEFGHILGLPDLYPRPENPGSEGAGMWCAMSQQAGNGRPQHLSAWCKERMGWLRPAVLDPRTPQKLILGPIEGSATECCKVLVKPDGSEYLLLENRRKSGFDASLPAEGLLIWRVVGSRPMLEESHGIDGPLGPVSLLSSVPYPSGANDAFTPHTMPSSRSYLGGGLPVYITNIRRLDDGRITFHIGYRYL